MSNSQNFLSSINAFVDKAKAKNELVVKKASIEILQDIIRMSPVGQPELWQCYAPKGYVGGRFRGNWQVTFNAPASVELDRIDPSGMDTLKDGIEQIGRYTYGVQSIYFTNNLPYSVRLEFGHSKQAPNGIVRGAALNAQVHFENATKGG
ncbi:hypothetical protein GQ597_11210 [Gilliamella sp. Pra-s65]|uniref:HK97 gp10 family phage protein n=1 Tax=unclassified Gilliamella TaxID=2685620 RepID=UPI00136588E6|nr:MULTISPECIES: HK97 gp10 family phage protein [unclassified Gilliamella]MWN91268.1 hypothetical protein [Gilliamella sp. Pra-s65]MWP74244.1 hypothetical protein [Gilliamella sp. Pra-s52]